MKIQLGTIAIALALLSAIPAVAHPRGGHHGVHHGGYHQWQANFGLECSPLLMFRSPEQVLADRNASMQAQDWDAVACDYAKNAFVISDNGVDEGREVIKASLQGLSAFFGGTLPTITSQVAVRNTIRVTFEIDIGWLSIPDGVDTYIIERGQIQSQTAHGLPVFLGPPPGPAPGQ